MMLQLQVEPWDRAHRRRLVKGKGMSYTVLYTVYYRLEARDSRFETLDSKALGSRDYNYFYNSQFTVHSSEF